MQFRNDLFSIDTNAKTVKGQSHGYLTGVMYLAPAMQSGTQMCPFAALAQCEEPCLYTAGRGAFNSVQQARLTKTHAFIQNREWFMESLARSIEHLMRRADKLALVPVARPNGVQDVAWENVSVPTRRTRRGTFRNIFECFPDLQFYDYTKTVKRLTTTRGIANYDLTFSYSDAPAYQKYVDQAIREKARLAVVFRDRARIPETFRGMHCIDGDDSDLRFLEPQGCVVALYAKGRARKSTSPLVVNN